MLKNKSRETHNAAVIKQEWLFSDEKKKKKKQEKCTALQLNQRGWMYLSGISVSQI